MADVQPPGVPPRLGGKHLAKIIWAFELTSNIVSTPWLSGPPFPNPADVALKQPYKPDNAVSVAWLWETCSCIAIDGGVLLASDALPENWHDWGVAVSVVEALVSLFSGGIACAGASDLDRALQILPVVPNLIKLGRLTPIVEWTGGVSLLVVAGADAVFGVIIAVLTFAQGLDEESAEMLLASPAGMSD
jgi:hypothetical protein